MAVEPTYKTAQECLLDFFETEGLAASVTRSTHPRFHGVSMIRVYTFRQAHQLSGSGVYHVGYLHFHRRVGELRRLVYNWDIHVDDLVLSLTNGYVDFEEKHEYDSDSDRTHTLERLSCDLRPDVRNLMTAAHTWAGALATANKFSAHHAAGVGAGG